MGHAIRIRNEAGVRGQVRVAQRTAQARELCIVTDSDDEGPI